MNERLRVMYGKGHRVLNVEPMESATASDPGERINLLIERPDGTLLTKTIRAKHRPYEDFYGKLQVWVQKKLNQEGIATEDLPKALDADLMNEIAGP